MEFMPKLILTKRAGRRPTILFIYKRIHQDLKFLGPEVVPTYRLGRRIFRIHEIKWWLQFTSVQFSHPVMSNSLWPHELQHTRLPCPSPTLELAQTQVHWVSDAFQPFHLLLFPSPPAFNLSQHQGLFQWVNSSHQVTKILELHFQPQSFQWIFSTDLF